MRKILLVFTILINSSCFVFGQYKNLSITDIVKVVNSDVEGATKHLKLKGFTLVNIELPEEQGYFTIYDFRVLAEEGSTAYTDRLEYMFVDNIVRVIKSSIYKAEYVNYVRQLNSWGCKLIKTYKSSDEYTDDLYSIFQGKECTYIIRRIDTSKQHSGENKYFDNISYTLTVLLNNDFNRNYNFSE